MASAAESSVHDRVDAARAALDELMSAAQASVATWTTPRAAGKWSPSQLVEHIARSLEESANDLTGAPSGLPTLPRPARFLARTLVFNRVLRKGAFPKAKTNRAMDPASGPATPEEAMIRLEAAWTRFERACSTVALAGDTVESCVFGVVPLADYIRFQEFHMLHHRAQLPGTVSSTPRRESRPRRTGVRPASVNPLLFVPIDSLRSRLSKSVASSRATLGSPTDAARTSRAPQS